MTKETATNILIMGLVYSIISGVFLFVFNKDFSAFYMSVGMFIAGIIMVSYEKIKELKI